MSQTTINTTDSPETGRVAINANFTELYSNAPTKRYVALLSQDGTANPVATIILNTLSGAIVWTRSDIGDYVGTLASEFTLNKTFCVANIGSQSASEYIISIVRDSANAISLKVFDITGTQVDNFSSASILIEVYP